jgi:predicted nucleic acid-binding protein
MAVVSDANILSSLAAADALDLLPQPFSNDDIFIPPAVEHELQAGLTRGVGYLERIFQAIQSGRIRVLNLAQEERDLVISLPDQLHNGERECIALCQIRGYLLLSNDKRAVRYCQSNAIDVVNLEAFLRLLWLNSILTRSKIETLMKMMEDVENLTLTQVQRDKIFAPRRKV